MPSCKVCKYRLLNDGWCSNCDAAQFVQERDIEEISDIPIKGEVDVPTNAYGMYYGFFG